MATTEHLAQERKWAPWAAAAAVLAGVVPFAGGVWYTQIAADEPTQGILTGLGRGASGGQLTNVVNRILFQDDHVGELLPAAIVLALGTVFIAIVFRYLALAARARSDRVPRLLPLAVTVFPLLYALVVVLRQVALSIAASDFASSANQNLDTALDAFQTDFVTGVTYAGLFIGFSYAIAFVLVSLHAMRVGLLTRFMGILGIALGVLVVLGPFFGSLNTFMPLFWFPALAALFLLRWPSGTPPAWKSGKAEPWPTNQELREQRLAAQKARDKANRARPEKRPVASADDDDGSVDLTKTPSGKQHTSSKKKRKRR